jgi:peptidoglycan-associated lipoprotein
LLSLLLLLAFVLIVAGCKKPVEDVPEQPEPEQDQPAPPPEPEPEPEVVTEPFPSEDVAVEEPVPPTVAELNRSGVLKTVYFAFDSSDLDDTARATIQANAEWLADNGPHKIVIEGHCDERGTIEYNLALGERRASAVRDYMASLGIPASGIRIVSYGEERPANPGRTEAAWAQNRRGEFIFEE